MGYLSAEGLLEEVLSWRLMIVPVLRTTGVNTKILVALELGVPLVITPASAPPTPRPARPSTPSLPPQLALAAPAHTPPPCPPKLLSRPPLPSRHRS